MKQVISLCLVLNILTGIHAQELSQVTFNQGSQLGYFSFATDQGVLIRISDEGKILEWGTEVMSDRYNYFAPRLQPFMGRIEYFGAQDDSVFRGKVKSIGTAYITYFDTFQVKSKIGKLRSIGNQYFDYYEPYEDKFLAGKIKSIGGLYIDYYRSYDDESLRGKIKLIGSVRISYYTVFDDRFNAGKLKSIGSANYSWYSLSDPIGSRGGLKSNNYRQLVSGITYILN
ncbi:MAG: hypothetical protein ACXVLT_15460 [Flavisolibacter sp.]